MKANRQYRCSRTALALAMLAAFGAAYADDDAAPNVAQGSGYVSVGAAGVTGDKQDRSLFGQYSGYKKDDAYLLLDFGYVKRDEATGTWTVVEGANIGLDTREVRGMFGPQGNWKVYGEYTEIVRRDPRTYNTGVDGIGGTNLTVTRLPAVGAGNDVELKTERKRATIGGEKWITPRLQLEASFINEDKDGERLFGRGFACTSGAAPAPLCPTGVTQWAILFLPEPISSTTQQVEAKLNYLGESFTLTGGYYGTFYQNDNSSLNPTVVGNLNNPLGAPYGSGGISSGLRGILQLPMALPPDNQAHQFYVAGTYRFTPGTNGNFKYAYTNATQHESFGIFAPNAPGGRNDLGGKLTTQLAQAGIVSRVLPKLQLLANVKYEDRSDDTPIDLYNIEGTDTFTNSHIDLTRINGKAEATYFLPSSMRITGGFDYESIDRGEYTPTSEVAGLTALRRKTYDRSWRLELHRSMSETLTGMVSYVRTDRTGSSWLKPNTAGEGVFPADPDCTSATVAGVPNACIFNRTGIFPYMLEDRTRDKVRVLADWSPIEKLSLQFGVDYGKDDYTGPTEKGLNHTKVELYSVDASYAISDKVKLTGYWSYGEQTLVVAHSTGYMADIRDKNTTLGIGLVAKPSPRLKLGADLMYINDRNEYGQTLDALASASNVAFLQQSGGLPDVTFRDLRLKLTGTYAIQKNADIAVMLVHDRTKLDEWTWGSATAPFVYSDNTTVTLKPNQNVTFVGVRYTYRFK